MGDTDVLRCFYPNIDREFSIKEIVERSGLTYKPIYFTLMNLVSQNYLLHTRRKWKHFFRLNLENPYVRKELEVMEVERGEKVMQQLGDEHRKAIKQLIDTLQERTPLLCVLMIGISSLKPDKLHFYVVVSEMNDYVSTVREICDEVGATYLIEMGAVTSSLKVFRHVLLSEPDLRQKLIDDAVVVFGVEFFVAERARAVLKSLHPEVQKTREESSSQILS